MNKSIKDNKATKLIIPPHNWVTVVGEKLGISRITVWRELKARSGERYNQIMEEARRLAEDKGHTS